MFNFKMKMMTSVIGGVILMAAGHALAADQQPIVIKFPYVVANSTPKGQGALMFQKMVKNQLGGRVKVELYSNSSLYNATNGLNALVTGDVQMMAPGSDKLSQYSKSVELFDLPFLFDDLKALRRFETGQAGQKILHSMEDHGIRGLAYWHNGMREISANQPLIEPSDARGLKLRTAPTDVLAAQVKVLHAVPRKMAFDEVYQGMQTGVIDGQGGDPYSDIASQKWNEVQSDITESNNGVLDYIVLTNAKFWNGLPQDIRSKLTKILAKVTKSVNDQAQQLNEKAKQTIIQAGGTKIHKLTKSQLADWRHAMQPVIKQYQDMIGPDLVKAAQQANKSGSE